MEMEAWEEKLGMSHGKAEDRRAGKYEFVSTYPPVHPNPIRLN